jgi:hypothetical protein
MQTIRQMTSGTEHSSITRRFLNLSHVPAAALLCLVTILAVNAYLPKSWFAGSPARLRKKCGVPEKLVFKTEPELGLEMITKVRARDRSNIF